MQPQPALRRHEAALAQQHGIAAPLHQFAPQVAQPAPRALAAGEDRAVGRHHAPRHTTATLEEAHEVPGDVGQRLADGHREHVGAGGEQRRDVDVRAAVHADRGERLDGGHRAGHEVDRRVRGDGEARLHQLAEPRLVEPHELRRRRERRRHGIGDSGEVRADGTDGDGERRLHRDADAGQRGPERHGPDELPLHRTTQASCRSRGEERPDAGEGVVGEVGDDGAVGIEGVDVDGDAAVLAERDAVDADHGLGDHPLGRRATGQRRDRRDVVLPEGERGGVVDRAMGEAADAGGDAGPQALAECRHGASGAMGVGAACRAGRCFDRRHRAPLPSPTPFAGSRSRLVFYRTRSAVDGSHRPERRRHVRRSTPLSANLLAVPDSLPPPSAPGTGIWAQLTLWGARLAWLAAAVLGGRAIGDAVAARSEPVQLGGHDRRVDGVGGRGPGTGGARAGDADRGPGRGPRSPRRRRRRAGGRSARRIRAQPGGPGVRRLDPRRRGRHRTGLRPGVGVRRRAALPAATTARLPRRDGRVVVGLGGGGDRCAAGLGGAQLGPRRRGHRGRGGRDMVAAAPLAPAEPALPGGRAGRARRPRSRRARRDADAAPAPDRRPRPGGPAPTVRRARPHRPDPGPGGGDHARRDHDDRARPTPGDPRGRAIHLRALLVAPSRPGAVLRAAAGDAFLCAEPPGTALVS